MREDIKEAIESSILSQIETLDTIEVGSAEHRTAVNDIANLVKIIQADDEWLLKGNQQQFDHEIACKKLQEETKKNEMERETRLEQQQFENDLATKKFEFESELETKKFELEKESQKDDNTYKYDHDACDERIAEGEAKDRKLKIVVEAGLAILLGVGRIIFDSHWLRKGFRFEETGSITSTFMRNIIQNKLNKKG